MRRCHFIVIFKVYTNYLALIVISLLQSIVERMFYSEAHLTY